jgi:hypothetical protein
MNENIETIGLVYIDKFISEILNDKQRKKNEFTTILQKITTFIKKHKVVFLNQPLNKNDKIKIKTISTIKTSIHDYMKELYNMCGFNSSATKPNMVEDIDGLCKEEICLRCFKNLKFNGFNKVI